jgi:hypothetical protein
MLGQGVVPLPIFFQTHPLKKNFVVFEKWCISNSGKDLDNIVETQGELCQEHQLMSVSYFSIR